MVTQAINTRDAVCVRVMPARPVGALARVRAWLHGRAGSAGARVLVVSVAELTKEDVLAVLPDASPELREAIESGCCTYFTVAEGHCGSSGCGTGRCCYHAVSANCGIDSYGCVGLPCSHGNFSTGC